MDNFTLDVTGRGDEGLRLALELAFLGFADNAAAAGWRQDVHDGTVRMVLSDYWASCKEGWHPLPAQLDASAAAPIVRGWLNLAEYPDEPDHDGDNVRGWRVVVGPWGRIEPYGHGAFASVLPAWATCGK